MTNKLTSRGSAELSLMDLINLGLVLLFSLRNTIIFIIIVTTLYGFIKTANVEPEFRSNTRILIELQNRNLKDEQNIDFSSLNSQAIQTEIEKIKSNTLIHNVLIRNYIEKPRYILTKETSSYISYLADKFVSYSGIRFLINILGSATSDVTQKALEKTIDVTLDTVVNSIDEEKVSEVSEKIRNDFNLSDKQNKKLIELENKFLDSKPDSEEVMSFAYDILSTNDYSDQDIVNLAKNYLPKNIDISEERLLLLIEKYKGDPIVSELLTAPKTIDKKVTLLNSDELNDINSDELNDSESDKVIADPKDDNFDYFEGVDSSEFNMGMINWVNSRLSVSKDNNANVINISFISSDAALSTLISNAVAEEYLRYQTITKANAGLYSLEYYQNRIDDLRKNQNKLSNVILNFESENDIYSSKINNLESDLRKFEDELRDLEDEKEELTKIYQ